MTLTEKKNHVPYCLSSSPFCYLLRKPVVATETGRLFFLFLQLNQTYMGKHKSVFGKVSRVGKKERMQRIVFSNAKEWNLYVFIKNNHKKCHFLQRMSAELRWQLSISIVQCKLQRNVEVKYKRHLCQLKIVPL